MEKRPCSECNEPVLMKGPYFAGHLPTCDICTAFEIFAESLPRIVFNREAWKMAKLAFTAGYNAGELRESGQLDPVDPARVKLLQDKLRRALVMSTRWRDLIEEEPCLPLAEFAKQPPVQVEAWNLDECRAVWEWLQSGGEVPSHLASEVARFRA